MRRVSVLLAVLAFFIAVHCRWVDEGPSRNESPTTAGPVFGGSLRVGIRSEPQTWNRLLATDEVSHQITEQLHAALLRVNRLTQELEPELADSWSFSEDGRELTFKLRPDVRFSDGTPFTADDVAFTFRALHDPEVASPLIETAMVDGAPLVPEILDALTVRFELPRRTAVVERIFDSIYILPRHRLEGSLERGNFPSAYGIGTPEEAIVGLGPFVLERYTAGQRVALRRNPHYWKLGPEGEQLPYLEGITFEILPDANALMLRFRAGELDLLSPVSPEDFRSLKEGDRSDLRLLDLGPGTAPERIWFNLNPESPVPKEKRGWFNDPRFRRAISLAIDRRSIAKAVYLDLASPAAGPISPANHRWWNAAIEPPPLDRRRAKSQLEEGGFRWGPDGTLVGPEGQPVRFTLLTNAGNPHRTKIASLIQEDLAQIGVEMTLLPLDFSSLVGRITRSFDYEACLLSMSFTDPDPSAQLPFWLSRSPHHIWHPSQPQPATPWEARMDVLMHQQMGALEQGTRKAFFDELQAMVVEELPVIDLVVPHALVGTTARLGNLEPTPFWHPTLWNSEELYLGR
jgi:peptide/nickel transport system substrate-binding protein